MGWIKSLFTAFRGAIKPKFGSRLNVVGWEAARVEPDLNPNWFTVHNH